MFRKVLIAATLAASPAALSAQTSAPAAAPARQASIPFLGLRGIRDFRSVGDDVIYLQARDRRWFRGEIVGPCIGLPQATRIGVDTFGSTTLDRTATLLVDGDRCMLKGLVESPPPPKRRKGGS